MTARVRLTAWRYQSECRAIRLAGERAVGVLLDAMKRSEEPHTRDQMKAAVNLLREAHALDFSLDEVLASYRPPGGCIQPSGKSDYR